MVWNHASRVVVLPSGLGVRGRRLSHVPAEMADFGVYLSHPRPPLVDGPSAWIHWRDFLAPSDPIAARAVIADLYARLGEQRCEVACAGGRGRTGTVLAALAILDGLSPEAAIEWIRERYTPQAVESPFQVRFLKKFVP